MQTIKFRDLLPDEVIDLVQYANDMMGRMAVYPVEYIVYREDYDGDDLELELEDVAEIMRRMGYPSLQEKIIEQIGS